MTQYTIDHFNKPGCFGPHSTQATRYTIEAHNIRNAMRRLWDDHRVNLVNGDSILWQDGGEYHRRIINQ